MTTSILSSLSVHIGLVSISTRFFLFYLMVDSHILQPKMFSLLDTEHVFVLACNCPNKWTWYFEVSGLCAQERSRLVEVHVTALISRSIYFCFFYDFVIGNNVFEVLSLETGNILPSSGHLGNGNSSNNPNSPIILS